MSFFVLASPFPEREGGTDKCSTARESPMIAPIVEVHELTKTFGPTPVLRGVDLRLFRGLAALIIGGVLLLTLWK